MHAVKKNGKTASQEVKEARVSERLTLGRKFLLADQAGGLFPDLDAKVEADVEAYYALKFPSTE